MDASPFARGEYVQHDCLLLKLLPAAFGADGSDSLATRPQRPTISVPGPREGDLHHHRRQTRQDSTVSSSSRSVDDEVEDIARQNQEFDTMYWKPLKEHANVQYPVSLYYLLSRSPALISPFLRRSGRLLAFGS